MSIMKTGPLLGIISKYWKGVNVTINTHEVKEIPR